MVRVKEQGWTICSHMALHNWSQLVAAAVRPVTMTMLEALEAPTLRRWRGAIHKTRPDASDVIRLAEDGEMMTAVLKAHRRPVGAAHEVVVDAAHPRPLSQMNLAELRFEASAIGYDVTAANLRTRTQLQETLRLNRPEKRQAEIPGLSKMLKPELITHCRTRGIETQGMTCDRMRLALQNWTPPTLAGGPTTAAGRMSSMAASSMTVPQTGGLEGAVPLQPMPKAKSRAPMPAPTPMTPMGATRSTSATPSPNARMAQPPSTPGGTQLMCPIHQCQLIMKQNRADRSLFWACAMYPGCKVTMPLEAFTVMDELMANGQAQRTAVEEAPVTQPTNETMLAQAAELGAERERLHQMELQVLAQQREVSEARERVRAEHQQPVAARERVQADHQQAMSEVVQARVQLMAEQNVRLPPPPTPAPAMTPMTLSHPAAGTPLVLGHHHFAVPGSPDDV